MEISQVITGMILFGFGMFIADLYNEVRKLKSRISAKPQRWYENKKDLFEERDKGIIGMELPMLRVLTSTLKGQLEQKDEEIKSLKAELNKCKFDYACEVAGGSGSKLIKRVTELESIIEGKSTTIKMQNAQIKDANKEAVRLKGIIEMHNGKSKA